MFEAHAQREYYGAFLGLPQSALERTANVDGRSFEFGPFNTEGFELGVDTEVIDTVRRGFRV